MTTHSSQGTHSPQGRIAALAERFSRIELLERPARRVTDVSARQRGPVADILRGRPLGHALHPALTDLPIGFWTSGVFLDLAGGKRAADAARRLIGLGVLSALPAAAAGLADVPTLTPRKRRVAIIHAASNTAALVLFSRSWWARARGRRAAGIVDGLVASAIATFGGYLGGWMAFAADGAPAGDEDGTQPVTSLAAAR